MKTLLPTACVVAAIVALPACRSSFEGATLDGLDPVSGSGLCPEPGPLPFTTQTSAFTSTEPNVLIDNPNVTHWGQDVLGLGDQRLTGTMARASGSLLMQRSVPSEWISAWTRDGAGGWAEMSRVATDSQGRFTLDVPAEHAFPAGTSAAFAVLEGDGTCAIHGIFAWPPGTQVVLTDIDGTLTTHDNEFIRQVTSEPSYVPKENTAAASMLRAWAAKGYQVVYLSARPNALRAASRTWLHAMGAPFGPLRTADAFVYGESARAYKAEFVRMMGDDLGWQIVAAYGNADSDIQAYEDAGIPKEVTFIVGPFAGESGTMAIGNNDFSDHIQSYVNARPEAVSTF